MSTRSRAEVQGLEYDWLGCDASGCVALFSTAGAGYSPSEFLRDADAHDRAIQLILLLPPSTEAELFPEVSAGLINTWRLVAERGLYAYDCDPSGGPYRRVAAPVSPVRVEALPLPVAALASSIRFRFRFDTKAVVTELMLTAPDSDRGHQA
ncbi:MAG: hypothetical protein IPG45_23220 [Deltaproteobacteria bacterium]|jgi:hypothetical protein|nr:hypothetical protein [Deltaproteobacteria bacterium]